MSNEIISTIKAELVAEVVIEKGTSGWSNKHYTHIPIKVGNKVENIKFHFERDYKSDSENPVIKYDLGVFQLLLDAGIAIDMFAIEFAYLGAIEVAIEARRLEEIDDEIKRKIQRNKDYDKSWIPLFKSSVADDKRNNKRKFNIVPMTRAQYMETSGGLYVMVEYRGLIGFFRREHIGVRFNRELKYTVTGAYDEARYKLDGDKQVVQVTDDKERRGKEAKSVVRRWFTDVDTYFSIEESRKARKLSENQQQALLIRNLEEASGLSVEAASEYRSSYDRNSRGYYVKRYYIHVGPETDPRKVSINMHSRSGTDSYSFSGMSNLTLKQFQDLIKVF